MTWAQLVEARPDLAAAGEKLLCQFGVRLAFLATVRSDGGPRLYPIAPLLADGGLFAFLERSSKRGDLHNDGRYALHTFPCPDNEDAFYLSGRAELPTDVFREGSLRSEYMAEREWESPPPGFDEQQVFELFIEHCMHTETKGYGDPEPKQTIWFPGNRT